jgi:beta-phosphoglucomutase-like phosphatase (HAD superfamily)
MKFDGIIFDFNGVLWWDSHLQEQAWMQFSAQIRGTPFAEHELAVHIHGRTNQHTLEYLTGRSLPQAELAQLTQQKESLYRQLCLDAGQDFCLSPGAMELLDYLVSRDIRRTIATASEKTNLDFFCPAAWLMQMVRG